MSNRTSRMLIALALLALTIALAACSVSEVIAIKADGSGTASMRVETSKLLREYLLDLQSITGAAPAPDGQLFDVKALQKELAARPGITVKKIAAPTPDQLDVDLAFRSV